MSLSLQLRASNPTHLQEAYGAQKAGTVMLKEVSGSKRVAEGAVTSAMQSGVGGYEWF